MQNCCDEINLISLIDFVLASLILPARDGYSWVSDTSDTGIVWLVFGCDEIGDRSCRWSDIGISDQLNDSQALGYAAYKLNVYYYCWRKGTVQTNRICWRPLALCINNSISLINILWIFKLNLWDSMHYTSIWQDRGF